MMSRLEEARKWRDQFAANQAQFRPPAPQPVAAAPVQPAVRPAGAGIQPSVQPSQPSQPRSSQLAQQHLRRVAQNSQARLSSTENIGEDGYDPNSPLSREQQRVINELNQGLGSKTWEAAKGVLNVADAGVRGVQASIGERSDLVHGVLGKIPGVGDELAQGVEAAMGNPWGIRGAPDEEGELDTEYNPMNIVDSIFKGDISSAHAQELSPLIQRLPGPAKPVVGFVADIATDPTLIMSGGIGAAGRASAATVATDVAETFAREAGERAVREFAERAAPYGVDEVASEVATKLYQDAASEAVMEPAKRAIIQEVGTRGSGGLTSSNIARKGLDEGLIDDFGLRPQFGLHTAGGQTVSGTQTLGEIGAEIKGTLASVFGTSRAGNFVRNLTTKNGAERVALNAVRNGTVDAPEGALILGALRQARGEAHSWVAAAAQALKNIEKDPATGARRSFRKASVRKQVIADIDGKTLAELEEGSAAWHFRKFFDDLGEDLVKRGVLDANQLRQGYVPARFSKKAMDRWEAGDKSVRRYAKSADPTKPEGFQMPKDDPRTLAERNAEFRAQTGADYDLLETDLHTLTEQYLDEGASAIERAYAVDHYGRMYGAVKDPTEAVEYGRLMDEVIKRLDETLEIQSKQLAVLSKGAREHRSRLSAEAKAVSDEATVWHTRAGKAQASYEEASRRVRDAEVALEENRLAAEGARGAEQARIRDRITELENDLDTYKRQQATARSRYTKANHERLRLREEKITAEAELATHRATLDTLKEQEELMATQREALDGTKATDYGYNRDTMEAEFGENVAARQLQEEREAFVAAAGEKELSDDTLQWVGMDAEVKMQRASAEIANINSWLDSAPNRQAKRGKDVQRKIALAEELKAHIERGRDVLSDSRMDEVDKLMASLDIQEAAWDFRRLQEGATSLASGDFRAIARMMNDPEFQDYMTEVADQGFSLLERKIGANRTVQVNTKYSEMLNTVEAIKDPAARSQFFKSANKMLFKPAARFMAWWKSWALGTPGFVIRNMYSGMFNAYMDGVMPQTLLQFGKFRNQAVKHGDQAAHEWATRKWGKETADRMLEARRASAATGGGITKDEAVGVLETGGTFVPTSSRNVYLKSIQNASGAAEEVLRGGHAYGVLKQGGSYNEAVDRVTKFQFNYRDISNFDKNMKQVVPFWMFFSRNLPLQAEMWATRPGRINRSYINAQRNIEDTTGITPSDQARWVRNNMPLGAVIPGTGTGVMLDIPTMDFPNQVEDMVTGREDFLINQLGPVPQFGVEWLRNKDSFSGKEFDSEYTQYGDQGVEAREHPMNFIPGAAEVMGMLPGHRNVDGELLQTDLAQNFWNTMMPAGPRAQNVAEVNTNAIMSMGLGARGWQPEGRYNSGMTPAQSEGVNEMNDRFYKAQEDAELEALVQARRLGW